MIRRAAILAFVAVVVSTSLTATQGTSTASQTPAAERFLMRIPVRDVPTDLTFVRELGFGWLLVEAKHPSTPGARGPTGDASTDTVWVDRQYDLLDDPLLSSQWPLENVGQSGGTVDADIDAPQAWATSTGETALIAVIDSGVDLDHPDLVDRLWTNVLEVPGNTIDDDGNGYVDDEVGWDLVDHDPVPRDTYGHGTAVAGIAAASDNGVGTVGVAPSATIMPLRVCKTTSCSLSAIVEAISYAIDKEVDIINLSLGTHAFDQPLADAVEAARDAGIVVVAASGNDGTDNDAWPLYPASLPFDNVISVAATDDDDLLAEFAVDGSNWGAASVDLGAPGKAVPAPALGGGWASVSGTSFATPHVSGVVSLVISERPTATPAQVRGMIIGTADDVPSLASRTVSGGRLNAAAAVAAATTDPGDNLPPIAVIDVQPSIATVPATMTLSAARSSDPDGSIVEWAWRFGSDDLDGEEVVVVVESPGVVPIELTVTDELGGVATATSEVHVGRLFRDTGSSIFEMDIAWLSAEGITKGCNPPLNDLFCPTTTLTRGQLASFLARLLALPMAVTDYFVDDDASVHEVDINRLARAGITSGCNPPIHDRFCPESIVNRAQFAAFVARALDLPDSPHDYFSDDLGSIFEHDINRLAHAGITNGCNPPANDHFCPSGRVTREQLAAFVRRASP